MHSPGCTPASVCPEESRAQPALKKSESGDGSQSLHLPRSVTLPMLPELERFKHRLLEALRGVASGAYLLGALQVTNGETEAQSRRGTSPMSQRVRDEPEPDSMCPSHCFHCLVTHSRAEISMRGSDLEGTHQSEALLPGPYTHGLA